MNKPIYHITPEKGWMNDPNGLVEYNGVYHVFYQADPEHLINENIGWGHKISSDLLHWEECHRHCSLIKVMTETGALPGVQ